MQQYPLVTIVGGSGFIGRHTVKQFTGAGWRVRVLTRDTVASEFLKMAGYPGQVVLDYADVTDPKTLEGKFAGSTAVVNLVGVLYSRGKQSFNAVHVRGARAVAEQAAAAGAKSLVHISALPIGADSRYSHTKKTGEDVVRGAFANATILRPSLVVGPEDSFFQRFAQLSVIAPALPLVSGGTTKFQPLLVTDLAQAILTAITVVEHQGKTYELAGPETLSLRALFELLRTTTNRKTKLLTLPSCVANAIGFICELIPLIPPMITRDQVRLLKADSVVSDGAEGFAALGITPAAIGTALPAYLSRFTVKR